MGYPPRPAFFGWDVGGGRHISLRGHKPTGIFHLFRFIVGSRAAASPSPERSRRPAAPGPVLNVKRVVVPTISGRVA